MMIEKNLKEKLKKEFNFFKALIESNGFKISSSASEIQSNFFRIALEDGLWIVRYPNKIKVARGYFNAPLYQQELDESNKVEDFQDEVISYLK